MGTGQSGVLVGYEEDRPGTNKVQTRVSFTSLLFTGHLYPLHAAQA